MRVVFVFFFSHVQIKFFWRQRRGSASPIEKACRPLDQACPRKRYRSKATEALDYISSSHSPYSALECSDRQRRRSSDERCCDHTGAEGFSVAQAARDNDTAAQAICRLWESAAFAGYIAEESRPG